MSGVCLTRRTVRYLDRELQPLYAEDRPVWGCLVLPKHGVQQLALLLDGRCHPKRVDVDVEQIAFGLTPLSDSRPALEGRCLCRDLALQLRDPLLALSLGFANPDRLLHFSLEVMEAARRATAPAAPVGFSTNEVDCVRWAPWTLLVRLCGVS